MCDETTERELDAYLKRKALTRRGFAVGASAVVVAGNLLPAANAASKYGKGELTENEVLVPTPDGEADALFIHPSEGAHAAVIFWPDVHGVRPAFFDMARRLAGAGYSVLAMNPYYRTMKGRLFLMVKVLVTPAAANVFRPITVRSRPKLWRLTRQRSLNGLTSSPPLTRHAVLARSAFA